MAQTVKTVSDQTILDPLPGEPGPLFRLIPYVGYVQGQQSLERLLSPALKHSLRNNRKLLVPEWTVGIDQFDQACPKGLRSILAVALSTMSTGCRMSDRTNLGQLATALLRVPVPWVFVLTYLAGAGVEAAFRTGGFLPKTKLLTYVGYVIFTVGAGLAAWGWVIFWRARTTRVPGEASTALVTSGPYRLMRNPMYVGLSVAYIGEAAILHQIVPVMLLPLTIAYLNRIVIPVEEERLHSVFGAEYEQYQNDVRRWL